MSGSARWRAASLLAALVVSFAFPAAAAAVVSGGCTAEGHSSRTSVDITTADVWHLLAAERAGGSGTSPVPMRSATVGAYAFGILIPIASNSGNGATSGSVDDQPVSNFATLGKVFVVAGKASGEGESCDGQILVVIDDVDALFTLLGGGGLIVFVLALGALLMASRSSGCVPKILATIFGGLGGAGLALSLEQFQFISPTTYAGLAILIAGAVLGFLVAGMFGKPKGVKPSTPRSAKDSMEDGIDLGIIAMNQLPSQPVAPPPAPAAPPPPAEPPPLPFAPGAEEARFLQDVVPGDSPPEPATPPEPSSPGSQADDYGPDNRPIGGGSPN